MRSPISIYWAYITYPLLCWEEGYKYHETWLLFSGKLKSNQRQNSHLKSCHLALQQTGEEPATRRILPAWLQDCSEFEAKIAATQVFFSTPLAEALCMCLHVSSHTPCITGALKDKGQRGKKVSSEGAHCLSDKIRKKISTIYTASQGSICMFNLGMVVRGFSK